MIGFTRRLLSCEFNEGISTKKKTHAATGQMVLLLVLGFPCVNKRIKNQSVLQGTTVYHQSLHDKVLVCASKFLAIR